MARTSCVLIMPFRSQKQRKFLWANHPEIARRWSKDYGSTPLSVAYERKRKNRKKKRKT